MAEERKHGAVMAQRCVRINFANLLLLAHTRRPVRRLAAAGSIPTNLCALWDKIQNEGVKADLFDRHG